jgi:hypothetical protein
MRNPAVDAYIAKSAGFAKPILRRLRALMHRADPAIAETIKWGVPHFEHDGIVAGMAAFKQHVAFGFWGEKLIREKLGADAERLFPKGAERGMGGRKLRSLAELPKAPPYLAAALKANAKARATWAGLTPGQQREYVEWLVEAKQAATRERRLAQALAWLAEGKQRYWKYQDC